MLKNYVKTATLTQAGLKETHVGRLLGLFPSVIQTLLQFCVKWQGDEIGYFIIF